MAYNVSDDVLLCVGVVVLAMCICIDVYKAYKRGAKWLPGCAVGFYALCLQWIGYLDVQNVSIGSNHKDQQLEVLVSKQLSVDSSRLVLFVFVAYLMPNLASTYGFWTTIVALLTSLSTHIAIEMSVALQSKIKVVKGPSGIWLILSDFVLLESILIFLLLTLCAIGSGRFSRDSLGSRIPLALESPPENNNETISKIRSVLENSENNNETISRIRSALEGPETISWDTCQSEMLKSWIVARVSQPDYVLNRSALCNSVAFVTIFNVVFMGVKLKFLRSHFHGPWPLFTIQCIFIILGCFALFYRCHDPSKNTSRSQFVPSIMRYMWTSFALTDTIENSVCRSVVEIGGVVFLVSLVCIALPVCIVVIAVMVVMFLVTMLARFAISIVMCLVCPRSCLLWLNARLLSRPSKVEDIEFSRYKEALELVCMPGDDAQSLWLANKSTFGHMRNCIDKAYERGKSCEKLQKVIGSRLAQNISSSEDVKELLRPLESVKRYFPLLKDSFHKITASALLMDDVHTTSEDQPSELKGEVRTAFKEAEELMGFLDCPDNVGISIDIFNISNLEAFELTKHNFSRVRFNSRESSTVANAVEKVFNEAKNKLETCKLLGALNSEAIETEWFAVREDYVMYKICKMILGRPIPDSAEQLQDYLINMAADLITMCVTESPKILVERSRKWAAEFREDKISAAIELAGFACGVIDGAKKQHLQLPV